MKLKRMLEKVEAFLSARERERRAERDAMHKILKKLKKKEQELRAEAEAESDEKLRASLRAKCTVVHAQRKKGIEVLKETRKKKGKK